MSDRVTIGSIYIGRLATNIYEGVSASRHEHDLKRLTILSIAIFEAIFLRLVHSF